LLSFLLFYGPVQLHHLDIVLGCCLIQCEVGDDACPQSVLRSEASEANGLAHGLLDTGWCGDVDRYAPELVVDLVFSGRDLADAELSGDAACPTQQDGGERFSYVEDLVAHDCRRVEYAPLDADAGME
jgi:hypothetical protein